MLLVKTKLGASKIHGIGLFADQFIPQGAYVWRFLEGFDQRLSQTVLEQLSEPVREQFLKYTYFDSKTASYELCADDSRFFNHSDTPNTASLDDGDIAVRDIEPGEELTCDYRTFDRDWKQKLSRS